MSRRGVYRKEPVGVFSQSGLEYMAIEPHLVAGEMDVLFAILAELLQKKQAPAERFFWGSWLHLMITLIHPFSDGNGRMARLCEKWFLATTLGEQSYEIPLEEHYWKNRSQYYSTLKLGVNYWEVDMKKASPFFMLLPQALIDTTEKK
jgi:Fic family protein